MSKFVLKFILVSIHITVPGSNTMDIVVAYKFSEISYSSCSIFSDSNLSSNLLFFWMENRPRIMTFITSSRRSFPSLPVRLSHPHFFTSWSHQIDLHIDVLNFLLYCFFSKILYHVLSYLIHLSVLQFS